MSSQSCTRRGLTSVLGVLGAAFALKSVPISAGWTVTPLTVRLAGLISSRNSAQLLSKCCLAVGVDYHDADAAITHLEIRGGADRCTLQRMTNDELREYVRNCVRSDYVSLRVIDVDGWILSEAEARILSLCAPTSSV